MSFTIKTKGDKKVIIGSYIPKGHSCECKSCYYEIELPICANNEQINGIVNIIEGR